MKNVRIFAGLSLLIMFGMIAFAILTGDFAAEGSILLNMVWGQMSLVDLYVAFFLVYLWIFHKETKPLPRVIWAILLIVTGSLATALYIFLETYRTNDIPSLLTKKH